MVNDSAHILFSLLSHITISHFLLALSLPTLKSLCIPKTVYEALSHVGWCAAIVEEMTALDDNCTSGLVSFFAIKRLLVINGYL